jgi:hypothetical protein
MAVGQHETRHAVGQRGLADALCAADQPSVRIRAAAVGGKQCRLRLAMTNSSLVSRGCLTAISSSVCGRSCRRCRARHRKQMVAQRSTPGCRASGLALASMNAAVRIFLRDLPISVAQILVGDVLGLEAVGLTRRAAPPLA